MKIDKYPKKITNQNPRNLYLYSHFKACVIQFGPASEKDLLSVVPTGIHISDKMDATII